MKKYDSYEEYLEKYKNQFDDFEISYSKLPNDNDFVARIAKKDLNEGSINFSYIRGYLTITGDMGSAVFTWHNPKNTLHHMAKMAKNSGYFGSKLVSEPTDGIMLYDQDLAISQIKDILLEHEESKLYANSKYWINSRTESLAQWQQYLNNDNPKLYEFSSDIDYILHDVGEYLDPKVYYWIQALNLLSEKVESDEYKDYYNQKEKQMTNKETRYISFDRMWLIFDTLNTRVVKDLIITVYRDGIEIKSNFMAFDYFAEPISDKCLMDIQMESLLKRLEMYMSICNIEFSEIKTCKEFYCKR